jgi:hypothetical protein
MTWFNRNAILVVLVIAAVGAGFGAVVTMVVCAPSVL